MPAIKRLTIYAQNPEDGEYWRQLFEELGVTINLECPPPKDYPFTVGGKTPDTWYDGVGALSRLATQLDARS